ncbi:hypothetical protein [Haloarcula sp. Atlit-7R]|uniref:hypothetical protein n=1 Tax=Haloarcula sp. Atlit-7R TaxID=2282125 RepID=UPI000EF1691B|nr:hypothetical protein [Haloarcula sp. Atlit-7R]RLM96220.1 hypothetical protein D3D01_07285 [Haloarcula sp. Atlit-7R]
MTRARSVLLAALIVCSAVVGAVGPALAQSTETATDSGPVTKTFETGPHKVKIDLFDVSSETTITVLTDESPAGNNTAILKKTVSGSQNSAHFRNAGAYESFTVKVEGAGGPVSFSKGGPTAAWTPGDDGKFLGDTGGDPGFTYDLSEQIGESVMPQVVQLDRTGLPDSTTVDTSGTDLQQIKTDVYQSGQNQKASNEHLQTTVDNYLQDTKTQARIIGKNAYIKALNNGSSKAAAKTEAKNAVEDYYAVKQVNLLNAWSQSTSHAKYLNSTAVSEGASIKYVGQPQEHDGSDVEATDQNVQVKNYEQQASTTLLNGSSASYNELRIHIWADGNEGGGQYFNVSPVTGEYQDVAYSSNNPESTKYHDLRRLAIQPPTSEDSTLTYLKYSKWASQWTAINSQAQTVKTDMDTLAENTYSAYQKGEINNTDLVDPYVLANQQSVGEDFQGWTAAQLTLLGTNSPKNFDQIGSFNITTGSGTQYEGVLFSQENPASGQFENGTTYNTSNIGGTQYVVTSDRIVELDGTFTIEKITTTSGENVQNVTIQKTQYKTTNVTELRQQYEDLAYRRAQIEAREKALRQSAGGGLLGGGSVPPVVALAVVGTLLGIAVLQD